jgi:hypothetical protein
MEAASLVAALRPLMLPPTPGAPGPFALSDESGLRRFAAESEAIFRGVAPSCSTKAAIGMRRFCRT